MAHLQYGTWKLSLYLYRKPCICNICPWKKLWMQGRIQAGSWGADDPTFQGWISCTSLLCLAKQPALPPSLQLMIYILDLTQNIAKNLFVRWESQVSLTSRAGYLVHSNDVGMIFTKLGVAKKVHARLFSIWPPPPTWCPESAPGVCAWYIGNPSPNIMYLAIWILACLHCVALLCIHLNCDGSDNFFLLVCSRHHTRCVCVN